jgi:hypothetical protein
MFRTYNCWCILFAATLLPLITSATILYESHFTDDLDDWQPLDPWLQSSVDGMNPGDNYLRMPVGMTSGNKGSKLIAFNPNAPWTGDLLAAGVIGLRLDFANWSEDDDANVRIVFGNRASPQQTGGTWWISSEPVVRPLETGWTNTYLPINSDNMVRVGNLSGELGIDTFEETLQDVQGFRILSSVLGQAAIGDAFIGVVGMDNIQLIGVPEPRLSAFLGGSAVFAVTLLRRRRQASKKGALRMDSLV